MYHRIHHVALRMPDLREAEAYYCALFGASVAFREAHTADGWKRLPPGAGWGDADEAGIPLHLSVIKRDGLHLALFAADAEGNTAPTEGGRLDHINVEMDAEDVDAVHERAVAAGCRIALRRPHVVIFDDHHGVRWEMALPATLDVGATNRRWLDLGHGS